MENWKSYALINYFSPNTLNKFLSNYNQVWKNGMENWKITNIDLTKPSLDEIIYILYERITNIQVIFNRL